MYFILFKSFYSLIIVFVFEQLKLGLGTVNWLTLSIFRKTGAETVFLHNSY